MNTRKCPVCGEALVASGKKYFPDGDPDANDYIVQCPSDDCPSVKFTRFRYTMNAHTRTRFDEVVEDVRELEQKLQGKHYDFLNAAVHARKFEMENTGLAAELETVTQANAYNLKMNEMLTARVAELEKHTMVRWRTTIETAVGIDEEFHTNLDAAEEYIGMCALDRHSTITKCEIREVQNGA
jgi:hypothetical protein